MREMAFDSKPKPRPWLALALTLPIMLALAAGWVVVEAMRGGTQPWLVVPVALAFVALHAACALHSGWASALGCGASVLATAVLAQLGGIALMSGASMDNGILAALHETGAPLLWTLLGLRAGWGSWALWWLVAELAAWRRL